MEQITKIVQEISSFLWGWPMIVLLLGTHLYLTVRLRFPQLHILKALRLSVSKDREAGGDVSQFGALATSLAATIGTGNIIGVARLWPWADRVPCSGAGSQGCSACRPNMQRDCWP